MLKVLAILCRVRALGLRLRPWMILSIVDCLRPLSVARRLIVMVDHVLFSDQDGTAAGV